MIKGIDAQVMTQRVTEYSKDVSAALHRDELANEFADRMNKLNAQQEAKTVSQLEKAENARVNADQEQGHERQERHHRQDKGAAGHGEEAAREPELPGIGPRTETRLLDIEI